MGNYHNSKMKSERNRRASDEASETKDNSEEKRKDFLQELNTEKRKRSSLEMDKKEWIRINIAQSLEVSELKEKLLERDAKIKELKEKIDKMCVIQNILKSKKVLRMI